MNIAIILAGGSGTRMGSDVPKQFLDIYGKPLVVHTLESFDINQDVDFIAVVCKEEWIEEIKIWIRKYGINKVKWIIEGGKTRQESIYNALLELECGNDDIVLIHDAARPLVSQRIITENIKYANKYGAVDTVIPSPDTIVESKNNNIIEKIPNRKYLYLGQTPQSFRFELIKKAHLSAIKNNKLDATDDCQLILDLNEEVFLVKGDKLNFKITTFEDLILFKALVKLNKLEVL